MGAPDYSIQANDGSWDPWVVYAKGQLFGGQEDEALGVGVNTDKVRDPLLQEILDELYGPGIVTVEETADIVEEHDVYDDEGDVVGGYHYKEIRYQGKLLARGSSCIVIPTPDKLKRVWTLGKEEDST